jgi:hypothetical protein
MKTDQGVLVVVTVTNKTAIGGSIVEVQLLQHRKDAKPDIQPFDLASLGEVQGVHGPIGDPPKWMVSYKGKVSANTGDQIKPKA